MKKKMFVIITTCMFLLSCFTTVSTAENEGNDPEPHGVGIRPDLIVYEVEQDLNLIEQTITIGVSFSNINASIENETVIFVSLTICGVYIYNTTILDWTYSGDGPSSMKWHTFNTDGNWYHTISVYVDPGFYVNESNENNNGEFIQIESSSQ